MTKDDYTYKKLDSTTIEKHLKNFQHKKQHCGDRTVGLEGIIERESYYADLGYQKIPREQTSIHPLRCNQWLEELFQSRGQYNSQMDLFHGSPEKYSTLKPTHDYYGYRSYAAISCTLNRTYALAFGLINQNIESSGKIYLYELTSDCVTSTDQIGTYSSYVAYDVLFDVTDFEITEFNVVNFDYKKDREEVENILKGIIDEDVSEGLENFVKSKLKEM